MPNVRRVTAVSDEQIRQLAELLVDCVDGGASVSFMHPLPMRKAVEFWRGVADGWREESVRCSSPTMQQGSSERYS